MTWQDVCPQLFSSPRKLEKGSYLTALYIKVISLLFSLFSVDAGSLAEQAGFKVGDQIMEVNGKNFENLKHKEAVDFIKSQKHIIVTLKVTNIFHWVWRLRYPWR